LCEWLPYGYPEVGQVVILRVRSDPKDMHVFDSKTPHAHFVEVYMARLDGRRCVFTKTSINEPGKRSVPEYRLPLPPQESQRRSAKEIAGSVVRVLGKRFSLDP